MSQEMLEHCPVTIMSVRYAEAHMGQDKDAIQKTSKGLIEKSHLQSLQHFIELKKDAKLR